MSCGTETMYVWIASVIERSECSHFQALVYMLCECLAMLLAVSVSVGFTFPWNASVY